MELMFELFFPINLSDVTNPDIEKNYTFSTYGITNVHCSRDKNYLRYLFMHKNRSCSIFLFVSEKKIYYIDHFFMAFFCISVVTMVTTLVLIAVRLTVFVRMEGPVTSPTIPAGTKSLNKMKMK